MTDGRKCLAVQNLDLASEYGEFLTLFSISLTNKECSAIKCAILHPGKGYVASTNHYTDDDLFGLSPPDTESSKARLGRINWLLEHAKDRNLDEMFSFAGDHEHTPDNLTICRHGNISTVSSLVFIPLEKCIWIASRSPCSTPFKQFNVNKMVS